MPPAPGGETVDLPPIPPERRRQVGKTYRGRRLLRPWWRWRLKVIGAMTALVVIGAVTAGLGLGRLVLRLIE